MIDIYQQQLSNTYKTYPEFSERELRLLDWGLGLGGECGEVLDLLKHHVLHRETLDKMELAKELGDVLWYLTAIAETVDIRLSDVLVLNMAKLEHRHGKKYNAEGSAERHAKEENFKETAIYKELEASIMRGERRVLATPLIEPASTVALEEEFQSVLAFWKRKAEEYSKQMGAENNDAR